MSMPVVYSKKDGKGYWLCQYAAVFMADNDEHY